MEDIMNFIDLRSDTITQPTDEMRMAMFNAKVGDDIYDEDETMKKLEKTAAQLVNKEAAIFVPSGTMGNQLSIMTHTKKGDEVIASDCSHVLQAEVGAASVISSVTVRSAGTQNGVIKFEDIKNLVRGKNIHFPDTGLICIENATSEGTLMTIDQMKDIYKYALGLEIPVHLDGARIFNAAIALNIDVSDIASNADSVMFCLSKGLCGPVGSILAGCSTFIEKAKRNRKMLGGGLRQSGFLAAAGLIALNKMTKRLAEDHENAKILAKGLSEINGIQVDISKVQIDMVFANINKTNKSQKEIVKELLIRGIKANDGREGDFIRFVTNNDVKKEEIYKVIKAVKEIIN